MKSQHLNTYFAMFGFYLKDCMMFYLQISMLNLFTNFNFNFDQQLLRTRFVQFNEPIQINEKSRSNVTSADENKLKHIVMI